MNNIAPDIFRKRLLIEGYYAIEVTGETIKKFFRDITTELSLKTYGEPIVHATSGIEKTKGFFQLSQYEHKLF